MKKHNFAEISYEDGLALVVNARQNCTVKKADVSGFTDTVKNLLIDNADLLKTIGVGAGVGGALGYGSSFLQSPERRRPGRRALTGALLGGLGGLGYGAASRGVEKFTDVSDVERIKAIEDQIKSIKGRGVRVADWTPMLNVPSLGEGIFATTAGAAGAATAVPSWMRKIIDSTVANVDADKKPALHQAAVNATRAERRLALQSPIKRWLSQLGAMALPHSARGYLYRTSGLNIPSRRPFDIMSTVKDNPKLKSMMASRGLGTGIGALAASRLFDKVIPNMMESSRQNRTQLRDLKLLLEEIKKEQ